jgi:hypothetical protein
VIRSFPRDREAKKRAIEALLVKYHVDISRLWMDQTQVAQPSIGVPFTGPLVPIPFVFRDSGQSGASGVGNLCDATQVCVTIAGITYRGSGTAGGPYDNDFRCENMNGTFTLSRFNRQPEVSGVTRTTCQFFKRGLPFTSASPAIGIITIAVFESFGTYTVRLRLGLQTDTAAANPLTVNSEIVVYERAVSYNSSWPLTLVRKYVSATAPTCTPWPESLLITDCSASGTVPGDIVGSGFSGSLGCDACPDSFTFSAPILPNPYGPDNCDGSVLTGAWVLTKNPGGFCEWDTGLSGAVSGSSGGRRWTMYRNGSVMTLSGFNYDCTSNPVITLNSLDPCTGTMEFFTEDALISITVNPA